MIKGDKSRAVMLACIWALIVPAGSVLAANQYWDTNGGASGAGGASPSGTWSGANTNWSISSAGTGVTGTWTNGNTAIFSAGTDATGAYTITVSGTQTAGSITFEDGIATLSSGTISLSTGIVAVNAAPAKGVIASVISGSAGLTKQNSGELVLLGANTFGGNLTNLLGTLTINNASAISSGTLVFNPQGANLAVLTSSNSAITLANGISFGGQSSAADEIDVLANNTLTLTGILSGSHAWAANGPGTLYLSGSTLNTFGGAFTVKAGTVVATADGALGTAVGSGTIVNSGATLALDGGVAETHAPSLTLNGNGVGGLGAMQSLTGVNSFGASVTLASDTTIGANAGSTLVFINPLSGTANLTITNLGIVALTGPSDNYSQTLVASGTFEVDDPANAGTGLVTVQPGATLSGSGSAPGGVNVSGTIAPNGQFDSGSQTWNGGGTYIWSVADASMPVFNDYLNITNALTITATSGNKFNITVVSLDPNTYDPGVAGNFDNTQQYDFIIATASAGITGFSSSKFAVDTSAFTSYLDLNGGSFRLLTSGNDLVLQFDPAPALTTPPYVSVDNDSGLCGKSYATLASLGVSATDNQGISSLTAYVSGDAISFPYEFPVGSTYVTVIAVDNVGNSTTNSFSVDVTDVQPPTVVLGPLTIQLPASAEYTLSGGDVSTLIVSATDNCGVADVDYQSFFTFCNVGTNIVPVQVTDIHGNATTTNGTVIVLAPVSAPSVVYVDDDYGNTCGAVTFTNVMGNLYVGYNAFDTIQAGIDAVASSGTVNVAPGTYPEALLGNKPVTILGAQAGNSTTTRFAAFSSTVDGPKADPTLESVVTAAATAPGSAANDSFHITSSQIVVDGFVFDGNNPALDQTGAQVIGGVNTDSRRAIVSEDASGTLSSVNNIQIKNNIVQNYAERGIELSNPNRHSPATTGSLITGNRVSNFGLDGILLAFNAYADVTYNTVITPDFPAEAGIWVQDFSYSDSVARTINIANNSLTVGQDNYGGIWVNVIHATNTAFNLINNVVNAGDSVVSGDDFTYGIYITSILSSNSVVLNNNLVGYAGGQFDRGISIWNLTAPATVIAGLVQRSDKGISLHYNDPTFGLASSLSASMSVSQIGVDGCTNGIYVDSTGSMSSSIHADISGNTTVNNCIDGVVVFGATATATIGDNIQSITGNGIGVLVDAGKALIQNNDLAGNSVAAIWATNGATVDAGNCTAVDVTGLGISPGGNDLTGYLAGPAKAIVNGNPGGMPVVLADHNSFGATTTADNIPDAFSGPVLYAQTEAIIAPPTDLNYVCASDVLVGPTNLSQFIAAGGYFSANVATVSYTDVTNLNNGNVGSGTITRTYTVADACGVATNCVQTIFVVDTNSPSIDPVSPIVANADLDSCARTNVTWSVNASDNCGILSVASIPASGSTFPVGTTVVTNIATDYSGNTATNYFTVTISDAQAPSFTSCAPPVTTNADNTGYAIVPDMTPGAVAADNCGGVTFGQVPPAGSSVFLGVNPVTIWAIDQYGNSNSCLTSITVEDVSAPAWTAFADNVTVTVLEDKDPFATGTPSASDASGPVTITYEDDNSGLTSCDKTGVIQRTWTATDSSSNETNYVQTITVIDTNTPYFTYLPADIIVTNSACTAVVNFAPTAEDLGYFQGFENPAWISADFLALPSVDWNDYDAFGADEDTLHSHITSVPSGTDGIVSKSGSRHGVIDSTAAILGDTTGAFSRLGGYSSTFGSGFHVSQSVYINMNDSNVVNATESAGYGWDLSSAINNQSGVFLAEAVVHAAAYDSTGVYVAVAQDGSTDSITNRAPDVRTETHNVKLTSSGWYTFKWNYRSASDALVVDVSVLDSTDMVLLSASFTNEAQVVSTMVGGNRYLWFTFVNADKLAIDDTSFAQTVPVVSVDPSGTAFPVGTTTVNHTATDACGNPTNSSFTVTVINAPTTSLLTSGTPTIYGQTVTFTASIPSCTLAPTGSITFVDDGSTLAVVPLDMSGEASLSISNLVVGIHPIVAIYSGDTYYLSSTSSVVNQEITPATPQLTDVSASSIEYGQSLASSTISGTARNPYTGDTVSGTFQFVSPGDEPPVGTASHAFTFTPDDLVNYNSTGGNVDVTVEQATPVFGSVTSSQTITYGTASVTLSGSLSVNGTYPPMGATVHVTINSVTHDTTISDSTGDFSIVFPTATIPASDTPYTITYAYDGDSNFQAVSDTSTSLTVEKASSSWSYVGTNFIYNGTPQGPVATETGSTGAQTTVYVGTNNFGVAYDSVTPPTDSGVYYESNTVAADSNYHGATNSQAFVITQASPVVQLTTSLNPSIYGDNVTFTATVQTNDATVLTETYSSTITPPDGDIEDVQDPPAVFLQSITNSQIGTITSVQVQLYLVGNPPDNGFASEMFVSLNKDLDQTAVLINRVGVTDMDPVGGYYDGWDVTLSDSAINGDIHEAIPVGSILTGTWQPDGRITATDTNRPLLLSVFTNLVANGDWRLAVGDLESGGTMRLESWSITIMGTPTNRTAVDATGDIAFSVDASVVATVPVVGGVATYSTTNLTVPSHLITATYSGDNNYPSNSAASLTQTINQAAPIFSELTMSQTISYGTSTILLTGKLSATNGACPPSGETITVTINGNPQNTTISNTSGDFAILFPTASIPVSGSPYTITYSYAGDLNFTSASDSSTALTVEKATPAFYDLSGGTVTYGTTNVTFSGYLVAATGASPPSGETVHVTVNGHTENTTIYNGSGDFSVTFPTESIPVSGSPYTVSYAYDGDSNFNSASDTSTSITVDKATPTLVINSATAIAYSQSLSFSMISGSAYNPNNGAPVSGSFSFTSPGTVPTATASQGVTFTPSDSSSFNQASGSVVVPVIDPYIFAQPVSVTNVLGSNTMFSVTAAGSPVVAYQWYQNGSGIPGATASNYVINPILDSDGGNYFVVVSNSVGSITSSIASLTIKHPPVIVSQPTNVVANQGDTVNFQVSVNGATPFQYQWLKNGSPLSDGGNVSGATGKKLILSNVQGSDAATYSVLVTNVDGFTASSNATLTVILAPVITSQPVGLTNNAGTTAVFSVTNNGTSPAYRWYKNGTTLLTDGGNISGATTSALVLTNVLGVDAGTYSVVLSNSAGVVTSTAALFVVNDPIITSAPVSQTNNVGTSVTFNVTAYGTLPIGYQWRKDGINISGATSNSYTIPVITNSDAAAYTVVVSNFYGMATSTPPATLTVIAPPVITQYPESRTNNAGTTATFTVMATGTSLSYQWLKDGVPLVDGGNVSGATNATLTLSNVQDADQAGYTVKLMNVLNVITSAPPATLTVIDPPVFTLQPVSRTNNAGTTATFTVTVSGSPSIYHWFKNDTNALANGGNIYGADTATLTLSNVFGIDGGNYSVVVSNNAGVIVSSNATLTVIDPIITVQPVGTTNIYGSTVVFSVTVVGSSPLHYQWFQDSSLLSGENGSSLTINDLADSDAGNYTVVVTNSYGNVTSTPAILVTVPPIIISQPTNVIALVGDAVSFSVGVNGATPFSYQWQQNGTNVLGGTNRILDFSSVTVSNAGTYRVYVTNPSGTQLSDPATLSVYTSAVPIMTLSYNHPVATLTVTGVPTFTYALQTSTNLINWSAVLTNVSPFTISVTNTDTLFNVEYGSNGPVHYWNSHFYRGVFLHE